MQERRVHPHLVDERQLELILGSTERTDRGLPEQNRCAWFPGRALVVPGRLTAGANFAYARLPMVRDLENALDELVAHELVAAIAGDEQAREMISFHRLWPRPGSFGQMLAGTDASPSGGSMIDW